MFFCLSLETKAHSSARPLLVLSSSIVSSLLYPYLVWLANKPYLIAFFQRNHTSSQRSFSFFLRPVSLGCGSQCRPMCGAHPDPTSRTPTGRGPARSAGAPCFSSGAAARWPDHGAVKALLRRGGGAASGVWPAGAALRRRAVAMGGGGGPRSGPAGLGLGLIRAASGGWPRCVRSASSEGAGSSPPMSCGGHRGGCLGPASSTPRDVRRRRAASAAWSYGSRRF